MTHQEALERIRDLSSVVGDAHDAGIYVDLLDQINTIAVDALQMADLDAQQPGESRAEWKNRTFALHYGAGPKAVLPPRVGLTGAAKVLADQEALRARVAALEDHLGQLHRIVASHSDRINALDHARDRLAAPLVAVTCPRCGSGFADSGLRPLVCPVCGTEFM